MKFLDDVQRDCDERRAQLMNDNNMEVARMRVRESDKYLQERIDQLNSKQQQPRYHETRSDLRHLNNGDLTDTAVFSQLE